MSDQFHQCPRCTTVYLSPQCCDWCPGEFTKPIPPPPALPAEVWRDQSIQPDYMAAIRAMCRSNA